MIRLLLALYAIIALLTLVFQIKRREGVGPLWAIWWRRITWMIGWPVYWPLMHGMTETWRIVTGRGFSLWEGRGSASPPDRPDRRSPSAP